MSLFDSDEPTVSAPAAPASPPLDAATHAAAVATEKARLKAESAALAAPPPPPVEPQAGFTYGFCDKCGTSLNKTNASKLASGEVKHMGCNTYEDTSRVIAAPPPPPHSPISVNPPDQPKTPSMLEAAAPVPPHEIALIEDPEIKATVEEHARQHAVKAAAEAAVAETAKIAAGTVVWCPVSATKVVITTEMALARKFTCQCSKSYSINVLKPIKEGDFNVSVIPRHKPPKKDGEVVVAPLPPAPEKKISIIVESDNTGEEEEDEDIAVAVAPPPPPPPVSKKDHGWQMEFKPVSDADLAAAIVEDSRNRNGHAELHPLLQPHALFGLRAFIVEVIATGDDASKRRRFVLARTVKDALDRVEAAYGSSLGEVLSIETIPGEVIT